MFPLTDTTPKTNQRLPKKSKLPLKKVTKNWPLNRRQLVQNRSNERLTFRQMGGIRYRGITLTPSQFYELDKVIQRLPQDKKYHTQHLGDGIHFTQPCRNMFTLWKQAKSNPHVETAYFHFDDDSWQHYLKSVHDEMKSLLHSDASE